MQAFGGKSKVAQQSGGGGGGGKGMEAELTALMGSGKAGTSQPASGGGGEMNTMWGALKHTYRTEGKWGLFPPYAPGWIAKIIDAGMFNFIFWFWFSVCSSVAARFGDNAALDFAKGIVAAA